MPVPQISPLPPPPSLSAPAEFPVKAQDFLGAFPTLRTEANAQAEFNNQRAEFTDGRAAAAAGSASAAAGSAGAAAGSATAAAEFAQDASDFADDASAFADEAARSSSQAELFRDATAVLLADAEFEDKSRIINGAMQVWQRGNGPFTTVANYAADRWRLSGNGGASVQRVPFNIGPKLGQNIARDALRHSVSGQSGEQSSSLQQRIEGVRSYAGNTITVLGWARRVSGASNIEIDLEQIFGTGGSPSSPVVIGGQVVPLTSDFQPFAVTFGVPEIADKTLGTDNNDYLNLQIYVSRFSGIIGIQTIGVEYWGIHIRRGTHAAAAAEAYIQPDEITERVKCQRYYEVMQANDGGALGQKTSPASSTPNMFNSAHTFRVRKRTAPALAIGGTPQFTNASDISLDGSGVDGFSTRVTAAGAVYRAFAFSISADAEL